MYRQPTVIVVGSGLSGCMAAISAADAGVKVVLVSRDIPARSASSCLRDGIALAGDCPDSLEQHVADSLGASKGLCTPEALAEMVKSSSKIVRLILRMAVNFARGPEGELLRYRSIGSSGRRVAFLDPRLAPSVLSALNGQLIRLATNGQMDLRLGEEFLSPLVLASGECAGVVTCDMRSLETKVLTADAVVVCSGGYEAMFDASTASLQSDGAAIQACYECGAKLSNLEMVQFCPFTIPFGGKGLPLDEIFFDGKIDVEIDGDSKKAFSIEAGRIFGFGAAYKEDVAAEICRRSSHGAQAYSVLKFDANENTVRVLSSLRKYLPYDPSKDGLKAFVYAHRSLGGLCVDDRHSTSVSGLFAAGRAATAYSGAGVLGGNEILSSLYGGMKAGHSSAESARHIAMSRGEVNKSAIDAARLDAEDLIASVQRSSGVSARSVLSRLKKSMSLNAGLPRSAEGLQLALNELAQINSEASAVCAIDSSAFLNQQVIEAVRLKRTAKLASLVVESAMARKETRGAHVRTDFPQQEKTALHTVVNKQSRVELRPKVF